MGKGRTTQGPSDRTTWSTGRETCDKKKKKGKKIIYDEPQRESRELRDFGGSEGNWKEVQKTGFTLKKIQMKIGRPTFREEGRNLS